MPFQFEVIYGADHPFCTDCSGCNSFFMQCRDISVEYVPIEFSKDRELQTPLYSTSQETVVGYLKQKKQKNNWIIFNSGLHDSQALFSMSLIKKSISSINKFHRSTSRMTQRKS